MKSIAVAVLLLAAVLPTVWFIACRGSGQDPEGSALRSDPILALGHGTFLDQNAKPVVPDEAFVLAAQDYYVRTMRARVMEDHARDKDLVADLDVYQDLIHGLVEDKVLANALYLDWLLERGEPTRDAKIELVNHALRWHCVLNLRDKALLPKGNEGWWKGLDEQLGRELERYGIHVFALTNAGGPEYRKDCLAAGVPVPEQVLSNDWTNRGVFDKEFLSEGDEAELWMWTSDDPPGVCLALPRYGSDNTAQVLGVICLGTQSSKACFFDNPRGTFFPRNQAIPIGQFVGGADLVANGQGECSDCHAGENPYVVHPDKPAFQGLTGDLMPLSWYEPLVVAQWAHNPGPTNILAAISSDQECDSCHSQSYAGRFPQVSQDLSEYCRVVLGNATGGSKRTMPMGGGSIGPYQDHVDALKQSCESPEPKTDVVDVDLPDDPAFLSPPAVLDPIYDCATLVGVRGAVLDAQVELFIDGAPAGVFFPARNPQKIEFTVPPLAIGQRLTARQSAGAATSDLSPEVVVRDYRIDYPAGLPAPAIDPALIYECAEVIAVRHVPTAQVTVFSDGADPVTFSTSTGWTAIWPGKRPFVVGQTFTAEISICGDRSGLSPGESAVAAPSSLPSAHFDPSVLYDGQQLVSVIDLTNGSHTELDVAGVSGGGFTTPVWWYPEFDIATPLGRALAAPDVVRAHQKLCDLSSESPPTRVGKCAELTVPRIEPPRAGDTFVVVADALPGARIRVYDGGGNEIGDGSGVVILLSRPLQAGEIVTVVQQLGECTSRQGYQIEVLGGR